MKTKLMLKVDDERMWKKLKSIAALEGKTINDKVIELIKLGIDKK